ncbi:MAG: HAMP domain-containing sensor histidine kinase [Chloroflexota bacterium]
MDNQTPGPLHQAQALVAELQQQANSIVPNDLQAQLSKLDQLLQQAQALGEGTEASEVRQQLDDNISKNVSFNSLMVHEIRKPMTSIRGYTDMLAKPGMIGPMNDMQQQFIDTIRNNVIRMEGLVSDISDISKLNSGRFKLDEKMTTFGQVMMDVQKQAEPLIAEFEQNVTWGIPQGLPILNADAKQLSKVVFNLVKNAIQYTPKGGNITVKAERRDDNVLHVAVTDTGIGMKPEEIARLGEVFYRADHELVTSQKGYGLGLPIAKELLTLMKSNLVCESTPDAGSTFSFSIVGMG